MPVATPPDTGVYSGSKTYDVIAMAADFERRWNALNVEPPSHALTSKYVMEYAANLDREGYKSAPSETQGTDAK